MCLLLLEISYEIIKWLGIILKLADLFANLKIEMLSYCTTISKTIPVYDNSSIYTTISDLTRITASQWPAYPSFSLYLCLSKWYSASTIFQMWPLPQRSYEFENVEASYACSTGTFTIRTPEIRY